MALHSSISAVKYPPSDLYHNVTAMWCKLEAHWDQHTGNKLHSVKPHLGYYPLSSLSRRDAVVLQRLRIGHTRLSHSYLLSLSLSLSLSRSASLLFMWLCPYCYSFTPWMSALHYCKREIFFSVLSMEELLHTIKARNILAFIREIAFYHHL